VSDQDAADQQTLSDRDQTVADRDQSSSDLDQTAAEVDQQAAERDQRASERDQLAADRVEQVDEDTSRRTDDYARSRSERTRGSLDRDITTQTRSETARMRETEALDRDRAADERDAAARARDELAAVLDTEMEQLEPDPRGENGGRVKGIDVLMRAAGDRKRAARLRARAAAARESAAADRRQAAQDRRQAAQDRAASAEELALEGIDHLTGALRRGVGLAAIQREMDRAGRTDEPLVMAFVDVDGLKTTNDAKGHAAGDALLRDVAGSVKRHLRPYDVIARFGGDEFVCSLSGHDEAAVRRRFAEISLDLEKATDRPTITVGFATRRAQERLDDLVERADAAMLAARHHANR
jgi:diguanylate cyclase (GGDEF)-like protein